MDIAIDVPAAPPAAAAHTSWLTIFAEDMVDLWDSLVEFSQELLHNLVGLQQ